MYLKIQFASAAVFYDRQYNSFDRLGDGTSDPLAAAIKKPVGKDKTLDHV
jgi:hypothetical protein